MKKWAQRWWRSSGSTSTGSAIHSPSSASLLLQQDKQHLSSSFQSKKRGTLASGLWCSFIATSSPLTGSCSLFLLWKYWQFLMFQCWNCTQFIILMSALYSLQDTVQNYCEGSEEGWKDHHGPWKPDHTEEEWQRQQNDLAWGWWHFKWEKWGR